MSSESDMEQQLPIQPWSEDAANPHNWSRPKKLVNLGIVTALAFITPLESSVIVPGVPLVNDEFHETRSPVSSLVVSIFVLGFAFGPLLLSPLSELYGRRIIFHVCNVATLAFSIASAAAPNMASFIVFRFLAGSFGAGPMNIGGGSIADQIPVKKRGFVMAIFFTGMFVGPVVGPVMGGFIAKDLGWRWVFWIMVIIKGLMTIVSFIFLAESHGPTIQRWRAKSKPETSESGDGEKPSTTSSLSRALVRPIKMLLFSPIVAGMSLHLALVYSYSYLLFTTFATVFFGQYGFGTEFLGLSFLGLGFGYLLALIVLSWLSDWIQDHLTRKHGESKPEYRLIPILLGLPFLPIGLFVYGWTTQYKVHWIVPIIFTGFTGVGHIFAMLPTQVYMVDAFSDYAASALAATGVMRSIMGGTLPLAGLPLYSALGYGWGNSLLGFIAIVVSIAPVIFWKYGEALRKKYPINFD